jgi:hypothetical protein
MNRALLLVCVLLPASGWSSTVALTAAELDAATLARVDVRGTATAAARALSTVRALPPARLDRAREALREVADRDPYTGAAMQIPVALLVEVSAVDAGELPRLARSDWALLQHGLEAHVDVLGVLGVDTGSRSLADTRASVDGVHTRAMAQDAEVRERVEVLSAEVEAATGLVRPCPRDVHHVRPGQPWTLGMLLGGWHDALVRVRPLVGDAAVVERVDAMLALFDAYERATWGR